MSYNRMQIVRHRIPVQLPTHKTTPEFILTVKSKFPLPSATIPQPSMARHELTVLADL